VTYPGTPTARIIQIHVFVSCRKHNYAPLTVPLIRARSGQTLLACSSPTQSDSPELSTTLIYQPGAIKRIPINNPSAVDIRDAFRNAHGQAIVCSSPLNIFRNNPVIVCFGLGLSLFISGASQYMEAFIVRALFMVVESCTTP